MKTGTVLLIALGGLAFFQYVGLGVAGATYQIVFSGVQIKSLTNYVITLTVQNVSNSNVQLNSMAGTVSINGNNIGNISDFSPVVIPANSQKDVNVTIQPSLLQLPSAIIDLISNSHGTLNFTAMGNANIDSLIIPFNVQQSVTV